MIPPLIRKILSSRGINTDQEIDQWVNPRFSSIKDPLSIKNMDRAVDRLLQAFRLSEQVCIYADFDLDGTSGLALLKTGLQILGYKNLQHYQPKRLSEGYGLHVKAIEELKTQGVSLLVTVDVGITAIEAADKAKELGIDLIVTDHHLPSEKLPQAFAIVNPNQNDCKSGLGYLCGAGVAFYLLWALKRELINQKLLVEDVSLKSLLDCFAIGTLTDMVPLVGDNRLLVKQGMLELAQTQRPGLRCLLQELEMLGRPLSSQDVAIRFAPKLNALSRLENGILPVDLFLVEDEKEAQRLVKSVIKNNDLRVSLQADAEVEALRILKDWPHDKFVFLVSPQFHRGVVGLIATRVAQLMNVPTFIGSLDSEGCIVGSARVPKEDGSKILDALSFAGKYFSRFGGHAAAAGFETNMEQVDAVINSLAKFYENGVKAQQKSISWDADAELDEVNSEFMNWYDKLGPFGTSFPSALLKFNQVSVKSFRELKGGHVKIVISDGAKEKEALYFSPPENQKHLLKGNETINLVGEPQWNYFGGRKSVQILVKDLSGCESIKS